MKNIFKMTLTLALVFSLVACGNKQSNVSNDTKNEEQQNNPSQKLIMITNAEFPPYEFKDNNEYKGIDIELAKLIGTKLDAEIEILDIDFDSIIPSLTSNKGDFALAGFTVTEDRQNFVDFSEKYQNAVQTIIVPNDTDIETSDDLSDKKIGVQMGTTGDIYCTDDFGDSNVERFKDILAAVQAMKAGKIDACVVDDQVAKSIVESDNSAALKILDAPYAEEEYAIAVNKGNTELLNKINNVLKEIKSNGELKAIIDKYIK